MSLLDTKITLIYILNEFSIERTDVPLRLRSRFLYEPIEENLIRLKKGGIGLQ